MSWSIASFSAFAAFFTLGVFALRSSRKHSLRLRGIGLLLIIVGAGSRKLLQMNAGIFIITAELMFLIFQISGADLSPVKVGLILIFAGVVLLIINLILSKRMKKKPSEEAQQHEA